MIQAAIAAAPLLMKAFAGVGQINKANRIRPLDPGFQANSGLLDNQRIAQSRYHNYQLPGGQQILNNLNRNLATGMAQAAQGATSSGDMLDMVSKLSAAQNDAINALGVQEAQGKEAALGQMLDAQAQAGGELVRRNQFDNDRYQQKLDEKAALTQAGNTNLFGAFDGAATIAGSMLNYKTPGTGGGTTGPIKVGASAFQRARRGGNNVPLADQIQDTRSIKL